MNILNLKGCLLILLIGLSALDCICLPYFLNENKLNVGRNTEGFSLTVKSTGSSLIFPGGSFQFKVVLMQSGIPVQNAAIGIYDPVVSICIVRQTNSLGELDYISQTSESTEAAIYTYVFKYNDTQTPLNVAIGMVNAINLALYKMDAIGTDYTSRRTLVVSKRTPDQLLFQDMAGTIAETDNFSKIVTREVLSNPGTSGILLFTGLSCLITLSSGIPPAIIACGAGLKATAAAFGKSIVTNAAKKIIDEDNSLDDRGKRNAKRVVDFSGATIGVIALEPGSGLLPLETLSEGWDFGKVITSIIYDAKGKTKGICCTGNIKGTSKILSVSFYKKDADDYLKPMTDLYYDAFVAPFEHIGASLDDTQGNTKGNSQGDNGTPQNGGSTSGKTNQTGSYSTPGGYITPGSYSVPGHYTVPGYSSSTSGYTKKGKSSQDRKGN